MIQTYEATYDQELNKGIYGLSLVASPAMQGTFIALKEDDLKFKAVEERLVMGLILRPNKLVLRQGDEEDFNIFFSEETVKNLAHNFLKNNYQKNSTIEHKTKIEGVSIVELWIVDDAENDKANANGLSPMKGDCFGCMKIDNDDIWTDFVKTGKVKGFSIDAMVTLEKSNFKTNLNMEKSIAQAITDGFTAFLSEFKKETPLKLGSINSADGSVAIEFEGDTPTAGGDVWVTDAAGARVPLPIGDYELADDTGILVVAEVGKIAELKTKQAPAQMTAGETAASVSEAIKSIMIKYSETDKAEKEVLNSTISALELKLSAVTSSLLELSKQPAAPAITSTPTVAKGRFHELLTT